MVEIIAGEKGKGKTKQLLDKVNASVMVATGNIVYLDKSSKHMYELSNRVRMINCTNYGVNNPEMFAGFLLGIISQDHDIEKIYIDNFSSVTFTEGKDTQKALDSISIISEKFHIDIVICFATDTSEVPEAYKDNIIAAL